MSGARNCCRGAGLLEVLLALSLGLMLTLVVATLHARVFELSLDAGRRADAQDTLRIALAVLEYDLRHAGYWGPVGEATLIAGRLGDASPLTVSVSGDCGPGWTIDLDRHLEAWSAGWPLACSTFGGAPATGAVLVLRRSTTRTSMPEAGRLQVQSDPWEGRLTVAGEPPDPGREVRDLVVRAYYLSPQSTGDPLRPSLRRKTLQGGPGIVDEEVVPGVTAFEITVGIDTDLPGTPGFGTPNGFVAPELATGRIVAVRIRLQTDEAAPLSLSRTVALRNGPAT